MKFNFDSISSQVTQFPMEGSLDDTTDIMTFVHYRTLIRLLLLDSFTSLHII
jgi:hypothetical protein